MLIHFLSPNHSTLTTPYYLWWRYGDDASQATDTAIQSVVDVGVTAYNFDSLVLQAFLNTADQQSAKAKGPDLQPAQTEGKGVQKKEEEKKK